MTLLEGVVALVILALTAVGYLEAFQGNARSLRNASDWTRTAALAESAMESALAHPTPDTTVAMSDGEVVTVAHTPWPGAAPVQDVAVTVRLADGHTMTVHRLTRASAQ